ncbi:hypothetical protein [Arthrobacter sp. HY1533]|uniref:hypothetical protein n=1 Tax=Arthrobacter sp. HY1533 TaxID=2970919 RepID=UPI0022B9FA0C|nr:hypothetical protein [Arthrobacter sp. HY1533]
MTIPWLDRNIAAVSILFGTATLVAGNFVALANQPEGDGFGALLSMVSGNPGMWLLAAALAIAGPILWIPGILAAAAAAPARGHTLTVTGSLLLATGLAVGVGHFALFFGVLGSGADAGLSADAVEKFVAAEDGYILGSILLWVFLAGLVLGTLLLSLGLRMARAVPVWVPVAAVVFAVSNFLGGPVATIVGAVALFATFVPMAMAVRAHLTIGAVAAPVDPAANRAPRT